MGWSKLKVVAAAVTPQTDEDWARQVQDQPKRVLEEMVARRSGARSGAGTGGGQGALQIRRGGGSVQAVPELP